MTPEENALLARLDGKYHEDRLPTDLEKAYLPDYDDLNNLMPLAWKQKQIGIQELWPFEGDYEVWIGKDISFLNKDPKAAIQQALLAIAREKNDE